MKNFIFVAILLLNISLLTPVSASADTQSMKLGENGALMTASFLVLTSDEPYYIPFLVNKGDIEAELTSTAGELVTTESAFAIVSDADIKDGYYYVPPHTEAKFIIISAAGVPDTYTADIFMKVNHLHYYRTDEKNLKVTSNNNLNKLKTEPLNFN